MAVFVFGSNLNGAHGRGAARHARTYLGAEDGVAEGMTGAAYALPTKDEKLQPLPLEAIADYVRRFIEHARSNPDTLYLVTRIGCGLAGYSDDDIYPLFADAPSNCMLPGVWMARRDPSLPPRVIVAGSREFNDFEFMELKLNSILANLPKPLEIVSGGARGADQLGERYAAKYGHRIVWCPADWDRYGKAAGPIRNQQMSWYGTHLVCFWNGRSPGTKNMIETAAADGLKVRIIQA